MDDKKLYNKDSIESLSPLEFTRLRPGVYAGDTTYSTQLLVEIVSNAVDEFRLGHGEAIDILIAFLFSFGIILPFAFRETPPRSARALFRHLSGFSPCRP